MLRDWAGFFLDDVVVATIISQSMKLPNYHLFVSRSEDRSLRNELVFGSYSLEQFGPQRS
jgi:hypothetical protein